MSITNIPRSFQYFAAINATPNDFNLDAGTYGITVHATVWGTATLQRLLPNNATYVTVLAALSADGYSRIGLPAGQYRMLLAGVTALTGAIEQIAPGRMGGS